MHLSVHREFHRQYHPNYLRTPSRRIGVAIGSGLALPVSFGDRELLQVRVELEAEAVHLSVSR